MRIEVFHIPLEGNQDALDELNHFLAEHRVLSVTKEIRELVLGPHWCFCIEYLDRHDSVIPRKDERSNSRAKDYREILSPEDFSVYAALRELRKEISLREAIPVYTICTNEQLAKMVETRCTSLAKLKEIPGFGDAKANKYGEEFLKILLQLLQKGNDANETSGKSDAGDHGNG